MHNAVFIFLFPIANLLEYMFWSGQIFPWREKIKYIYGKMNNILNMDTIPIHLENEHYLFDRHSVKNKKNTNDLWW